MRCSTVGVSDDLDISVGSGSDKTRRYRTHRTVVRREGLIELSHPAADSGAGLYKINFKAGIGKIKSGLNAGDTTANNHYRTIFLRIYIHLKPLPIDKTQKNNEK